jgi:poly(beta-D-mannuronate) lyase
MGRFIAVRGDGSQIAQRLWIHHNYFFNFPFQGGANGAEPFQFGLSGLSLSSSNSIVEHNLFEKCHGENELLSVKASRVTIRHNTIRDCPAQLTLRHGNFCQVYGNYFINTPGLRIFGDDHIIHSNYFENCSIAINIGNGGAEVADGAPLVSHDRPDRVLIAFNTMVNNTRNYLQTPRTNGIGATYITFVNNIIQGGGPAAEISGPYSNPVWNGNIIFNTQQGDMPAETFKTADPKLVKDGAGVFRLSKKSPAVKKGSLNPSVTVDMDGQARDTSPDIGADEISSEPVKARMLTAAQVGCDAAEIQQ